MSKLNIVIDSIQSFKDRSVARNIRVAMIESFGIAKAAADDQHGILQHFQSGVLDYPTRQDNASRRSGESVSRDALYGVGPEHEDADNSLSEPSRSLSTRYSPDRVGVQARRVSDGVYQDPYTNKIYDYNEGFVTEDGHAFNGGTVDNQTKLLNS